GLELLVPAPGGALWARAPLVKRITTIGSGGDADVAIAAAPPHWLTVHLDDAGVAVRVLATGARHVVRAGEAITIDGARIEVTRAGGIDLERVAARLAGADAPADA